MKKALIIIFALISLVTIAQSETNKNNILRVRGEYITKQKPENIVITLRVTEKDSIYQKCLSKSFETRDKMIKIFEQNGIKEESIKTLRLSIDEQYNWQRRKEIARYNANINMQIEEEYSEGFANKLLKSLQDYSFQVEYSIDFNLSETQKEALRKKAIEGAIKDATEKAQLIAESSNMKLGRINRITYGVESETVFYRNSSYDLVAEYAEEPPPMSNNQGVDFNPKESSIMKTVIIDWKIKK